MPNVVEGYWGKAQPIGSIPWHPAAWHNLDVAAVAQVWLENDPALRGQLARLYQIPETQVLPLVLFFIAIHDLGKFTAEFQKIRADLWRAANGFGEDEEAGRIDIRHDRLGLFIWHDLRNRDELTGQVFPVPAPGINNARQRQRAQRKWSEMLAAATMGHHGKPLPESSQQPLDTMLRPEDRKAVIAHIHACAHLFPVASAFPEHPAFEIAKRASWFLAGFTTVCDWVGSNQHWFPYRSPGSGDVLDQYQSYFVSHALPQARRALQYSGLLPSPLAARTTIRDLFPRIAVPTPLQAFVERLPLDGSPTLVLIEDLPGSGKTEASITLSRRMAETGSGNGIAFQLPTMATSNAMFDRMAKASGRFFAADSKPTIVLAHGMRHLEERFTKLLDQHYSSPEPADEDADTASASCTRWLGDDRRKVFLAQFGVGTVDQALLSVLPVKFQSIRLFGLARRVVVVDEVHSYDSYMLAEIEVMLRFLAALGTSVVLMSATLPRKIKTQLMRGFAEGLELENDPKPQSTDYPLVTTLTASGVREYGRADGLRERDGQRRRLAVRMVRNTNSAAQVLLNAAQTGCACWIRNTVGDAMAAAAQLRSMAHAAGQDVEVILYHSRMALCDRQAVEARVMEIFGDKGTQEDRIGRILVATQVVEQSLDLDFDAMVVDLCPIDALIQRAGRLWRHMNRWGHLRDGDPVLHLLSPDPDDVQSAGWYGDLLKSANYVYNDTGLVWRTARVLQHRGAILMPEDVRGMVDECYGDEIEIPAPIQQQTDKAQQERKRDGALAKQQLLDMKDGFVLAGAWGKEDVVQTRLGRPQCIVRLGVIRDGLLVPWATRDADALDVSERAWSMSEIKVDRNKVAEGAMDNDPAVAAHLAGLQDWQKRNLAVVPLTFGNGTWTGRAVREKDGVTKPVRITYSPTEGMSMS